MHQPEKLVNTLLTISKTLYLQRLLQERISRHNTLRRACPAGRRHIRKSRREKKTSLPETASRGRAMREAGTHPSGVETPPRKVRSGLSRAVPMPRKVRRQPRRVASRVPGPCRSGWTPDASGRGSSETLSRSGEGLDRSGEKAQTVEGKALKAGRQHPEPERRMKTRRRDPPGSGRPAPWMRPRLPRAL